jgi:hypothetical protein
MRRRARLRADGAALVAGLVWWTACGGSSPVRPVLVPEPLPSAEPTPAPSPASSPIPTPTPEPSPTPCAACEVPVTNTNPAARLTLRLYSVEDPFGKPRFNYDPERGIPLEWVARLDVVGKDAEGYETNGQSAVTFHFSEPKLVKVSGGHTHQRRLKVLETGDLICWVTQDGIRSNDLALKLVR